MNIKYQSTVAFSCCGSPCMVHSYRDGRSVRDDRFKKYNFRSTYCKKCGTFYFRELPSYMIDSLSAGLNSLKNNVNN